MKGQSGETAVIAIILVLASGLVIGGAMQYFVVGAKNKINLDACRLNVRTAAIAAIAGKDVKLDNCFTQDVGHLKYSGDAEQYEKEVSLQIGQQLADCAYQFDPKLGVPYQKEWFGSSTVCFICSTFSFPEDPPGNIPVLAQDRLLGVLRSTKKTAQQSYFDAFSFALPFPGDPDRGTYVSLTKYTGAAFTESNPTEKLATIPTKPSDKYVVLNLARASSRSGIVESQSMVFMMPVNKLADTCGATFLRYP